MRTLLLKLLTIVLVVVGVLFLLTFSQPYSQSYLASAIDKHKLLETTPGPRIILIGGSNLAFGVNSEQLIKAFHRPVVNMGLNAALGLKYMLNEAQPYVHQDDWIILAPEYHQFYGELLEGEEALGELMVVQPSYTRYLAFEQYANTLAYSLTHLALVARHNFYNLIGMGTHKANNQTGLYSRKAYNAWGDNVVHLRMPPADSIIPHLIEGGKNSQAYQLLNEFTQKATSKRAKVFMIYPFYWDKCYNLNKTKIDTLRAELTSRLRAKIISRPEDFLFDESYLFDTEYHLNAAGVQRATAKIITLLSRE